MIRKTKCTKCGYESSYRIKFRFCQKCGHRVKEIPMEKKK